MNGILAKGIKVKHDLLSTIFTLLILSIVLLPVGFAFGADWAANYGGLGGGNVYNQAMATDAAGNVYLTGSFDGPSFTLGSVTLTRIGAKDAYVAKLDPSGTVLWAKNFGGSGASATGSSIAVDSGNVYLAGSFMTANLTTPALTKIGYIDVFAVKLDTSGATVWSKSFGGSGGANVSSSGITVDSSGNVYLGGYFQNTNLTTPALTRIGSTDVFAFKLDASGATVWAKNFGGSGVDAYGRSIAVDGSGNVYLGGSFSGANLTTPTLVKTGNTDAFAFKLDSNGATVWAKDFGGSGASVYIYDIAVDVSQNVYTGGFFSGADLTTPALTKIGLSDVFAFKLDAGGNAVWAKNFGGSGASAAGFGIAVDASSNVYLGGYFQNSNLTNPALTKTGSIDTFAIKLDAGGDAVWAKNFGGNWAKAYGYSFAVDADSNVYLGGYFSAADLTNPALTKIGTNDAFVLKLGAGGTSVWAKNFGLLTKGVAAAYATATDTAGNVYQAGYFDDVTLTLGSVTLTRIGVKDAYVAKLDAAGTVLWAKNFGGIGATAYGFGIAVDAGSNVYLGGHFTEADLTIPALTKVGTSDAFALKLDGSGATVWAKNFGGGGASVYGRSIAVDGSGNVYLGGYFSGANLTTPTLTKIGGTDAFALKLDAGGATAWAKNFGGSGAAAYGFGIAVDGSGNVYLGGNFSSVSLTTPVLTKIGLSDAFALRLDGSGTTVWAKNFGGGGAFVNGYSIAVDGSSNVYLGGNFSYANLTTPVLAKTGSTDAFAFKLDAGGATIWAKNFGGSGASAYSTSIEVDAGSNVYLGGFFQNSNLTTPAMTKKGTIDAFAFKLDAGGSAVWAKNFGGSGASAYGYSIAVGSSGNVFLGGYFSGANLTTPALAMLGSQDAFVIYNQLYNLSFAAIKGSVSGASQQTVGYGSSGSSVTAVPSIGYHFVDWTGTNGFVTTTSNPLTVTNVTTDMAISANFAINQYTVTAIAAGNGSGTISSNTGGIVYGYPTASTGTSSPIDHGVAVILTANAGTGSTVSWASCSGTVSGNGTTLATCSYSSLDGIKSAQATFAFTSASLNVTIIGSGNITSDPQGTDPVGIACSSGTCSTTFAAGTPVELLHADSGGYAFEKWDGDCTGSGRCLLNMNGNRNVTAAFTLVPAVKNITTGAPYVTLADALGDALSGAEIRLQDIELAGPVTLDKALFLKGGWYSTFLSLSGLPTTLNGDLTIQNGDSYAETLAVKGKLEIQGGSLQVNSVEVQ